MFPHIITEHLGIMVSQFLQNAMVRKQPENAEQELKGFLSVSTSGFEYGV